MFVEEKKKERKNVEGRVSIYIGNLDEFKY